MKKFILVLTSLILIFTLFSCSKGTKQNKFLTVGMELAYPPFEMTDKNGNPSGISVELAKEFGKYIGKEIKIQNIAWDGLIPALKTGKVDFIISSMTITKERDKSIDFSIPYSKSYLAILANINSNVSSVKDLNSSNITLALKKGTTAHIYAQKNLKKANILLFSKESECVLEVVQGKADGFIYDQLTIFRNWNKNQETTKAILSPFQDNFEYWGAAIAEGNDKLRKQLNEFFLEFKRKDGFNKLGNKYLSEEKDYFTKLGIPFFFAPSLDDN